MSVQTKYQKDLNWRQNNPEKIEEYNKKYISNLKTLKGEIDNLKAENYNLMQEKKVLNKKINDLELQLIYFK